MNSEIRGINHKFTIGGLDFYLVIGVDDDAGGICHLSLHHNREDDKIYSILLDLATAAIGYGMPVEAICGELMYHEFGLGGPTNNPRIPMARSVPDYIGRYIEQLVKLQLVERLCSMQFSTKLDPWAAVDADGVLLMDLPPSTLRQMIGRCLRAIIEDRNEEQSEPSRVTETKSRASHKQGERK